MSDSSSHSRPQRGRIENYPLLCLDIDGVCAPIGQNPRFHCHGPPPGFVDCGMSVQMHPAVPGWLAEVEAAFESVCWISSWEANCNLFAEQLGLRSALEWTHIDGRSARDKANTGIGRKLVGLAGVIDPAAPVAVVDDHLSAQYPCDGNDVREPRDRQPWGADRGGPGADAEIGAFLRRPGPTLLVSPASEVGLTRNLTDLLCRFAQDPKSLEFADRGVYEADTDWWIQWPAPLDPAVENPVRIEPDDVNRWLIERLANIGAW